MAGDPLPSHRFTVQWDSQDVAGVQRVGPLQTTAQGNVVARAPVTLERPAGVDDAFAAWADDTFAASAATTSVSGRAQTVRIVVRDDAGTPALVFVLVGAVPVSYSPLNALDATVSGIAIETLVLNVTDIRRDESVT